MEIEAGKVRYFVYVITEQNATINITSAVEGLNWQEDENELSMRITFEMFNTDYEGQLLSSLIKINQKVIIKADWGSGQVEVARGKIKEAERNTTSSDSSYSIIAYDCLFGMQKSHDNVYLEDGRTTQDVLSSVFSSWGVSISKYTGPNVSHSKILYKNKSLADIVLDILKEAKKKGGCAAVVRADKDSAEIVKKGGNDNVFFFDVWNSILSRQKISITNMITRVIIVGSDSEDESIPPVEATLNGKTEYGIVQQIRSHSSSEDLSEAETEAQELLDENGDPEETMTIEAPDVPIIRKGDKISAEVAGLDGYYVVKSINHNAATGKMNMDVEKFAGGDQNEESNKSGDYQVGDEVWFFGGMHYVASYPEATGYPVSAGPAKITIANGSGKAHPWCLETLDWDQTHVWGWVDEGSFEKR